MKHLVVLAGHPALVKLLNATINKLQLWSATVWLKQSGFAPAVSSLSSRGEAVRSMYSHS